MRTEARPARQGAARAGLHSGSAAAVPESDMIGSLPD